MDIPPAFPPYTYIPGGPHPHPVSDPRGHMAGGRPRASAPGRAEVGPPRGSASESFRRGVDLLNAGYYWEAHEVWEGLWHAHGRRGPIADALKGLIKLAAAGVKVRQGQPHGVRVHALRAADLLRDAGLEGVGEMIPLDLIGLAGMARSIASGADSLCRDRPPLDAPAAPVLGLSVEVTESSMANDTFPSS